MTKGTKVTEVFSSKIFLYHPFIMEWFLIAVATILIVGLLATVVQHAVLRTPFVRTSRKIAREMVTLAQLQPGEVVYDLGAGDGTILMEAVKMVPRIRAIGIECVPVIWFFGFLMTRGQGIRFRLSDARKVTISDADVVFLYMTPHALTELEPVLNTLKPESRIVSRAFRLPHRVPSDERVVDSVKFFLYHQANNPA